MNFVIVYARSGMGRILFVNQAQKLSYEQLQAKVDAVIPRALQAETRHLQDTGGQCVWLKTWRSMDRDSKALVIALEI